MPDLPFSSLRSIPTRPKFQPPQVEAAGCGLDPLLGARKHGASFCPPPPPRGGTANPPPPNAYTRLCTHKAVYTQGSLWPPQKSCHFRGVRGLAPALGEASRVLS